MFVASLLATPGASQAQSWPKLPAEGKYLSVGATVYLALNIYIDSVPPNLEQLERHGNPAARPVLYLVLNDPQSYLNWPGVIRMLGYVGDGTDGQKLLDFLKALREKPKSDVEWDISYALAVLRQRKQKGADELVDQVVSPAFWRRMHFRPSNLSQGKGRLPFDLERSYLAIVALARVDLPYARAKAAEIQASIEDADEKKLYGKAIDYVLRGIANEQKNP